MNDESLECDVAVIGGGPAGLSAALILGRSCRRVIVIDHGQYRNYAARQLHSYAGHDGITPVGLRQRCREEVLQYDVKIVQQEAVEVTSMAKYPTFFQIKLANNQSVHVRKIIFATGMIDELPEIPGLRECYGRTVHHCPYCDAWEHRGKTLVLLGADKSALKSALLLQCWSKTVVVCTNGKELQAHDEEQLKKTGIARRLQKIIRLQHDTGSLQEIIFDDVPPLRAEALFFSSGQNQRSTLPASLGCVQDKNGLYECVNNQKTSVPGVYVVGDAAKDLQFAIIAAAEGSKAAVAVHEELLEEDLISNGVKIES